jgi:UDPglucose 6-dehydrogenase
VYDRVRAKSNSDLVSVLETDVIFLCLPEDAVEDFFLNNLPGRFGHTNFVLKSTVPVGTTRRLREKYDLLNLVHSPEFLTERTAVIDAMMLRINIIGVPTGKPLAHDDSQDWLYNLYDNRFPQTPVHWMSSDESEAVKLFTNAFFATKVSVFNEFREFADKMGLDWDTVVNGMLADGRIHPLHTQVPGPDGKRGFGGKCLPKDLMMLCQQMVNANTPTLILPAVLARNKQIDRRDVNANG